MAIVLQRRREIGSARLVSRSVPVRVQCLLLSLVGTVKLLSVVSASQILTFRDQLLGVAYWHIFAVVGSIECLAGVTGAVILSDTSASALLAAFGAVFLGYRFLVLLTGANQFCPCFGTALDWLPQLAVYHDRLLTAIALWFCLSGFWFLWRTSQQPTASP